MGHPCADILNGVLCPSRPRYRHVRRLPPTSPGSGLPLYPYCRRRRVKTSESFLLPGDRGPPFLLPPSTAAWPHMDAGPSIGPAAHPQPNQTVPCPSGMWGYTPGTACVPPYRQKCPAFPPLSAAGGFFLSRARYSQSTPGRSQTLPPFFGRTGCRNKAVSRAFVCCCAPQRCPAMPPALGLPHAKSTRGMPQPLGSPSLSDVISGNASERPGIGRALRHKA